MKEIISKHFKILLVVLLIIAVFGLWKYFSFKSYCSTYFPKGTTINSIDCSEMTEPEVVDKLTDSWNKNSFTIKQDGKTMAVISDCQFNYAIKDDIHSISERTHRFPLATKLFGLNHKLTVSMTPVKNNKAFSRQVSALAVFDRKPDVITHDAYVDMSNTGFKIVKEVYGDNIDKIALKNAIRKKIAAGKWTLNYKDADFYAQPKVTSESQSLLDRQEYCKKYLSNTITYKFGSRRYTIPPSKLDKMMTADDSGKIIIHRKEVSRFVTWLANRYNTAGRSRYFASTSRGRVCVSGGTYGFIINKKAETRKLTENIKAKKNISREPVYAQKGLSHSNGDIGYTYVEVDIANQHLWYYRNGRKVMDAPVVTGCVATNYSTVKGVYSLQYKAADVYLRGTNPDGKPYKTKVSYWMPFYADYGMHDAYWRSSFGGSIYLKNGSHGCVNMPPSAAATLFSNISAGCPVVVF